MQQLYDLFKWWWFYFKFMIIHLFATEKSQPKSEVNIKIRNRNQPKPIKNRNWKFGSGRFGRFIQFLEPTAHGPSALAPSSSPDLVAAPPPPSSVAILLLPLLLHPQHFLLVLSPLPGLALLDKPEHSDLALEGRILALNCMVVSQCLVWHPLITISIS